MRKIGLVAITALLGLVVLAPGCSCDPENGDPDGGGGGGMDGGGDPDDGGGSDMDGDVDAYFTLGDGDVVPVDGGFLLPDGAVVACVPASCQGRIYQCGNCIDDDGDGDIDSADSNCLGPCDNNESGFNLAIPGSPLSPCGRDCYFDQDSGGGNDMCDYDLRCDPLSPGTRPNNPSCPADGRTCAPLPEAQQTFCEGYCGPLVPNGCDCYGCCDITVGDTVHTVYLGSVPERGAEPCSIATANDPRSCRPCTQNFDCANDCGPCELCLGRDTLPPECFPPPPPRDDAGMPIDAGMPVDGGPPPPPRCPGDQQACGLPGDPACPAGYFCLTGCCIYFG